MLKYLALFTAVILGFVNTTRLCSNNERSPTLSHSD